MKIFRNIKKLIPYPNTLLDEFIRKRLDGYRDPVRAGKPRGEKIGLTPSKYLAALLVGLTNIRQKDIAEVFPDSFTYGSLRQWGIEESFRAAANEAMSSFSGIVADHMRTRIHEYVDKREYLPIDPEPEYADAGLYRRELIEKISRNFFNPIEDLADLLGPAYMPDLVFDYARLLYGRYYLNVDETWRGAYEVRLLFVIEAEYEEFFKKNPLLRMAISELKVGAIQRGTSR